MLKMKVHSFTCRTTKARFLGVRLVKKPYLAISKTNVPCMKNASAFFGEMERAWNRRWKRRKNSTHVVSDCF